VAAEYIEVGDRGLPKAREATLEGTVITQYPMAISSPQFRRLGPIDVITHFQKVQFSFPRQVGRGRNILRHVNGQNSALVGGESTLDKFVMVCRMNSGTRDLKQGILVGKPCSYRNADKQQTFASLDLVAQFLRYGGSIKCHETLSHRQRWFVYYCILRADFSR